MKVRANMVGRRRSIDGREVSLFVTRDENKNLMIVFSRKFKQSDTRGLSLSEVKKKKVRVMTGTRRRGDRTETEILVSRAGGRALMMLLREYFDLEK